MKKKLLPLILCIALLFTACSGGEQQSKTEPEAQPQAAEPAVCAVWLSCYELKPMFAQPGEEAFAQQVQAVVDNCMSNGINTLFLQVRPFCDALYPSDIFPWSEYALDEDGNAPEYDPLQIFIALAHEKGIAVHAWINPYRVSYDKDFVPNEAFADFSVVCDSGVFIDPSRLESQRTVLDGVREILENYDVDGIHIDDYFYPVKDKEFDSVEYEKYCEDGGRLSLAEWRRGNVNSLVSAMYSLVHSLKADAVFSISPAADISKNKNNYYADVKLWCEQTGYADWIIPQIYFGFEHEKMPFEKVAADWAKLAEGTDVKLICGLAAYKQGQEDVAAGVGADEWVENEKLLAEQIEYVCSLACWYGYSLFSYSNLTQI